MPPPITAIPRKRQRLRQRQSQSPPTTMASSAAGGIAGTSVTAPGCSATRLAIHTTASIPQPMGASASPSSPSGMRTSATSPQGMIQKPVIGTAPRLASRP